METIVTAVVVYAVVDEQVDGWEKKSSSKEIDFDSWEEMEPQVDRASARRVRASEIALPLNRVAYFLAASHR